MTVREWEEIDYWAVEIVVREGQWMNLNRTERVLASYLLIRKGWTRREVADYLRVTFFMVERYMRDPPPVPIEEVLEAYPDIMGRSIPAGFVPPTHVRDWERRQREARHREMATASGSPPE